MLFLRYCLTVVFTLTSLCAGAARVDTLDVPSAAMHRTLRAAVVVPDLYQKAKKQSFPVLYLLHGGTGSYRDWLSKTPDPTLLHRLADQYHLIIVMPDGNPTSYYFDSPQDPTSQFETHLTQEVIATIDATYRTVRDRKGRVIAGLSMGGHGAFYLATQHPELYCAAGSMSGVMNIDTRTWQVPAEFAQSRAQNFAKLLGPPQDTLRPYPEYTAAGRLDRFKASDLHLIFDCGVDDFLIDTNRALHQLLLENGVPHDYTERPGAHTWAYWQNALPYQVLFLYQVLHTNGVTL
ncbi:S-formylglutathione hydrolase FrmB [Catalinimonas alkaloidigena]|uniref:S-formylglutathione hydrolase FrmB n=1 Tax=Catalinimonas alkaloidigena TaxID=1075417 RepID=A0A1G9P435_9BACT|nr:alpha/beta hydrolase family protein [Catalinimonas alkaloidigena]SDL92955.1 S-formylglutathione hydrolase FrmB [Catalinimonas alkaloidigena]